MLSVRLVLVVAAVAGWSLPSTIASGADVPLSISITFSHGLKTHSAPSDTPVRLHGVVRQNGRGVRGAQVTIAEPMPDASLVAVGAAKSDRRGHFAFTVPAGGTRTVVALIGVTVSNSLTINLGTHVFLTVAPRHVRRGGRVTFRGRVRDLSGQRLLVEIQVRKRRNSFQSFLVAPTGADGSFRRAFRFSHSRAGYVFRAQLQRQTGSPFARSRSQLLHVRVG